MTREEGCRRYQLPSDRQGDIIVIASGNMVLGTTEERHDLSELKEPLRSHGGLSAQRVPFIINRATPTLSKFRQLRNFDIFDAALNYALTE
jgi:phosphonoacetate hydrolase